MIFASAWWLVGLVAVAVAAAWALYRPGRRLAVVASLRLWQEAIEADSHSHHRRFRRLSASWILILAGCTAAALALAEPIIVSHKPMRKVTIVVRPSAELGPGGLSALKKSAATLLGRLDHDDQVELIQPACLGGSSGWLSPQAAGEKISAMELLPVPAKSLAVNSACQDSQYTYYFSCACGDLPAGPQIEAVILPCDLPAVSIDAIGATPLAGGKAQVYIALRKHQPGNWSGNISVAWPGGQTSEQIAITSGQERNGLILEVPESPWLAANVAGQSAFLARTTARSIKVAIAGRDEPIIRRFLKADTRLTEVADAKLADLIIANSTETQLEPGKPALLINPPDSPPGWLAGEELKELVLDQPRQATDDLIMRSVNFTGLSILTSQAWQAGDLAEGKVLLMTGRNALIVRSDPGSQNGSAPNARKIYLAFSLSGQNTNIAFSESLVIFMANAVGWLAGKPAAASQYAYARPLEAAGWQEWQKIPGTESSGQTNTGHLPLPGIYKDATGEYHAVSLVGLSAPRDNADPQSAAANVNLPQPKPGDAIMRFQLWLSIAACLLWLAGWMVRLH